MKILCLMKNFSIGGGERLIAALSSEAKNNEITIDVATIERKDDLSKQYRLSITHLTQVEHMTKAMMIIHSMPVFIKLLYLIRQYDMILSFERTPSFMTSALGLFTRKPYCVYIQNTLSESIRLIYPQTPIRRIVLTLQAYALRHANCVLCVTSQIHAEVIRVFLVPAERVELLEPCINTSLICRLIRNSSIKKRRKSIIFIGVLRKVKQPLILLDVLKKLHQKDHNVVLYIIGEGDCLPELRAAIQKKRLNTHVVLLGKQVNPYKYLTAADALILTSKTEAFPLVILESMYCGVPVISTNCSSSIISILGGTHEITPLVLNSYRVLRRGIVCRNEGNTASHIAEAVSWLFDHKHSAKIANLRSSALRFASRHNSRDQFFQLRRIFQKILFGNIDRKHYKLL